MLTGPRIGDVWLTYVDEEALSKQRVYGWGRHSRSSLCEFWNIAAVDDVSDWEGIDVWIVN